MGKNTTKLVNLYNNTDKDKRTQTINIRNENEAIIIDTTAVKKITREKYTNKIDSLEGID